MAECNCMEPTYRGPFDSVYIGTDETHGRFGEVSIKTCKKCGSKWLYYFVEYEAFTASGRWYRGLISGDVANSVTAETAVTVLEDLEWRISGGSYFRSTGKKGAGPVFVNL